MSAEKLKRIIDFQPDKQRTPEEAIHFMSDKIAKGECIQMLVLYNDQKTSGYLAASEKRDYRKSQILWDVEQWKDYFLHVED